MLKKESRPAKAAPLNGQDNYTAAGSESQNENQGGFYYDILKTSPDTIVNQAYETALSYMRKALKIQVGNGMDETARLRAAVIQAAAIDFLAAQAACVGAILDERLRGIEAAILNLKD